MHDQDFLNQIQAGLEQEKIRLDKELESFANKNIHNANDYQSEYPDLGDELDENAQEVADFGSRLSLERTLEKELRDVNSALKKIKDGGYGTCHICHEEITKERLLARPTSSTCVKCKKELKGEE